nr:hypothetical protein [Chryseobacterium camelliae]
MEYAKNIGDQGFPFVQEDRKVSYSAIGRILGVHRLTVSSFVHRNDELTV